MKISMLKAPREFEVVEEPVPNIAADEVLLRVAACGICNSDMEAYLGAQGRKYPLFLGHEVSGIVEKVGTDVKQFKVGDRVAAWVTGSGYAEFVAVKAEYVLPAGDVPLDEALAEPLACAVNTVEMANISLSDDVVIIGAGFMGALVQRLVMLQGPRYVIVADTRDDVLERAKRADATHTVNVNKESLTATVKRLTDGKGADVSFEVTGMQAPLTMLGDVTRMSGKVVIVGYHQHDGGMRQIPMAYWNWMAFNMLNAHFREVSTIMRGMQIGMRLLTSGRLSLADLVTHRFSLEQVGQAFQTTHDKPAGFLKSVVTMPVT
jgi:2-desacetyl-2-hydroxyethyl bacteriochlorophyllide A dehydrogenase